MENSLQSLDRASYSVAKANDLRFVPALMLNAMLGELRIRSLGSGNMYPFLDIFRALAWLGDRRDMVTVTLFRVSCSVPLEVRAHPEPRFDHRLEYAMTCCGESWWTPLTVDGCVQLLIPTHIRERYESCEKE